MDHGTRITRLLAIDSENDPLGSISTVGSSIREYGQKPHTRHCCCSAVLLVDYVLVIYQYILYSVCVVDTNASLSYTNRPPVFRFLTSGLHYCKTFVPWCLLVTNYVEDNVVQMFLLVSSAHATGGWYIKAKERNRYCSNGTGMRATSHYSTTL